MTAYPRLDAVDRLTDHALFTLNVGSGGRWFSLQEVRLDLNKSTNPDVLGDALHLPFADSTFDQVVFSDVVEHLPKGTETRAMAEIARVLKSKGRLVFSTPNDRLPYTWLDPGYHFIGHRHYKRGFIEALMTETSFHVLESFTLGGIWTCIDNIFVMFSKSSRHLFQDVLESRVVKEYSKRSDGGYTIFMTCERR